MNPSPPQASTVTSTGSQGGGGGESSRRGVSNRPSSATKPSVTVASTSHHSGRVSHQAAGQRLDAEAEPTQQQRDSR